MAQGVGQENQYSFFYKYTCCSKVLGIYLWAALWSQWFILLDILFVNLVKELYKYLELEEINHFDDQHHLQNLK